MNAYPDGNPKTAQGAKKVPLQLVPPSAIHGLAEAFKDGADKYGPYNWREQMVSASVYVGAMKRHQDAWWDGEDLSPDALVHHLKHVMACCAIIIDAQSIGMLNDDRPPKGAAASLQQEYAARVAQKEIEGERNKRGSEPRIEFIEEFGPIVVFPDPLFAAYDAHPGTPPATDTGD